MSSPRHPRRHPQRQLQYRLQRQHLQHQQHQQHRPAYDPAHRAAILLLHAVQELHRRGYHQIRALPYMAPSGMFWRCEVTLHDAPPTPGGDEPGIYYSTAAGAEVAGRRFSQSTTTAGAAEAVLAALGAPEPVDQDPEYVRWYAGLVEECDRHHALPVAFSDSQHSEPEWEIGWCSGVRHPQPPGGTHG